MKYEIATLDSADGHDQRAAHVADTCQFLGCQIFLVAAGHVDDPARSEKAAMLFKEVWERVCEKANERLR